MGTLADLVGGFQQGQNFQQNKRRERALDALYGYGIDKEKRRRAFDLDYAEKKGIDLGQYGLSMNDQFAPATFGEKMMSKLKGWGKETFGFGQQPEPEPLTATQQRPRPEGFTQAPVTFKSGGPVRKAIEAYKEGGRVTPRPPLRDDLTEEERLERSYGTYTDDGEWVDRYITESEGKVLDAENAEYARGNSFTGDAFARKAPRGLVGDRRAPLMDYDWEMADFGRAIRDFNPGALFRGSDKPAKGVAPDTAAAAKAQTEPMGPPEEVGAQPDTNDPPGQAAARQSGPVALNDSGQSDEIIDMSKVTIPPDQLPRHTVDEWAAERDRMMGMAAMAGMDPYEVGKKITEDQIRNFSSYMYQAQMLLAANDPIGAARAATAGFQYFPNGSDVKFGIHTGKDGKRHLLGLGRDEKTGEDVGTPMLLTPESIGVMINQAQNPDAWRTWTKDWRDADLRYRQFELDKDYKEHFLGIEREKAITGRINAEASVTRALNYGRGKGGLKQTDIDRAQESVRENLYNAGIELNDDQVNAVTGEITRIYQYLDGRLNYSTVQDLVIQAIKNGAETTDELFMYVIEAEGLAAE